MVKKQEQITWIITTITDKWDYLFWVDYSKRKWYKKIIITEQEKEILENWWEIKDWKVIETDESKQNELQKWIQQINDEFDNRVDEYLKGCSRVEKQTFLKQEMEADYIVWKSRLTGKLSDFLEEYAKTQGIDIKELAKDVKRKAEEYNKFLAIALWTKRKKIKELENTFNT